MKLNKRFHAETRNEMNFSSPFFILFLFLYIFFLARSYIFTQVKNRDAEIVCDNNSNCDTIHEISIILFITTCQKIIIKIISIVWTTPRWEEEYRQILIGECWPVERKQI